jgi:transcription antitermination protein NusB
LRPKASPPQELETIMINRDLIRIKTLQLVYSYYQNPGKTIESTEKELMFSLSKAYDMYRYLLMLITKVYEYGVKDIEVQTARAKRLHLDMEIDTRFADNRFARQLVQNKELAAFAANAGADLMDPTLVRKIYKAVKECDAYREYMTLRKPEYADDRTFWRKAYKACFVPCDDIDSLFEDKSLYWNDDRNIVDSFVIKSIKRFEEANGADQPLLPDYDSDDDRAFAQTLIRKTLEGEEEYRNLISENAKNWEISRMALMDIVIMQIAIAEIINFPTIPAVVTINEYLDLSKVYSTPRSYIYINGLLDFVVKKLRQEGVIMK